MDAGSGDSAWLDSEHLEANRRESRAIRRLSEQARARARITRHQVRVGQSRRETQGDSASARLQAKMGTMPVIEQAKGIVMAQQGCRPQEAFDLLRRVSQKTNVKVRVLAAHVVEQAASSDNASNVTPIRLSTRMYRRSPRRLGT